MTDTDTLLTVPQTCAVLDVPRRTLYQWWSDGRGPRRIKLPNGSIRVRSSVLDDWLLGIEEGEQA